MPLDEKAQRTFLGLMKWAWPWADGDSGPLGTMTVSSGFPVSGFFIAVTAATLLFLAALSVLGWRVPHLWRRPCTIAGAALSLLLMLLFFSPTKLIPIALDAWLLRIALRTRESSPFVVR